MNTIRIDSPTKPMHASHGSPQTDQTPLVIDGKTPLSARAVFDVAHMKRHIRLDPALKARLSPSRTLLQKLVRERRRIYGVTTGYGPLAGSYIDPSRGRELQRNLVYHLCAGVGEPLSIPSSRALMVARIGALSQGYSAISWSLLERLVTCLNLDLTPVIPAKGTVGASGDLTPLAHLTLALIGEGQFWQDGQPKAAATVLAKHGIEPLVLDDKEGIALVNGTSAMTGIAALNAVRARRALTLATRTSLFHAEMARGRREAWHPKLAAIRPHPGQIRVTEQLWRLSADSRRLEPCAAIPPILSDRVAETGILGDQPIPQDRYSIRCAPQILGAIDDLVEQHARTIEIELNAATDNPLFFVDEEPLVLHGGNFQGQQVAFASDQLMLAVIQLAVLIERQVAHLTHPVSSPGLPAFLQPIENGLHSGFMGAQVSSTALVAEMRSKAVPASIQSISTNGDNQDVVSMGTIAARRTSQLLDDLDELLAIQLLALAQAAELQELQLDPDLDKALSRSSAQLHASIRRLVEPLGPDRPLAPDIATVRQAWQQTPHSFELQFG